MRLLRTRFASSLLHRGRARFALSPTIEGGDGRLNVGGAVAERNKRRFKLRRRPVNALIQQAVKEARELLLVTTARFLDAAHRDHAEKKGQHRTLAVDDAWDIIAAQNGFKALLQRLPFSFKLLVNADPRKLFLCREARGGRQWIA